MFRLLIAENEYIEREAMKHIIGRGFESSYEIKEATNGKEAVEVAKSFLPDVIFMDIKMPGCSGIEAARQIREFQPDTIIIFVSAYDCFDYAKEAISLRVEEFLVKPVEIEVVHQVLDRITKRLEEEKKTKDESQELEYKFKLIKKQFQLEFFDLLENYNTSRETLEHYIHIMDIELKEAACVYLDFQGIDNYELISPIQREFIRERYMEKLKQLCATHKVTCINGELQEQVPIVFFESKTSGKEFLTLIHQLMDKCNGMIGIPYRYYIGSIVSDARELAKEMFRLKQKMYTAKSCKEKRYPYELEEELLEVIKRREFDLAKERITKIAGIFEEQYQGSELAREILGLYAVVKRVMLRTSPELMIKNADELIEGVATKYEMTSFFNRLFDYAVDNLENKPDKNQILIQNICRYIEEHYKEEISLEQAASVIGFSSYYFARLMKEYLNMSFVDYITSVRIGNAKKLLETTSLSVKEVGYEVGYEDPNYFTRVFKRMEGRTPSQYKSSFL